MVDTCNQLSLGGWEYGYNYQDPQQQVSPPSQSLSFQPLIDYFEQLPESHRSSVIGFVSSLGNVLQSFGTTNQLNETQSSRSTLPSHIVSKASQDIASTRTEKKSPLIVDKENPSRFEEILVNPLLVRKAEQCALLNKKPGVYLLNKVSTLLFSLDELKAAKGVSSLDPLKQEALHEYLRAKANSMHIQMVSSSDYRRTLQNKITNARKTN